jgi:cytochrome c biogenesis protein CcmG/thiol:disulfide interchange protein DsbE
MGLVRFAIPWIRDERRWRVLMGTVFVLGSTWLWIGRTPSSATTAGHIPSPREGFAAPDFTLESLDGETFTLSALRGRVVVVNLWASWCPPCREEMPELESAYRDVAADGVVFLGVNTTYQDNLTDATAFAERYGLTFPVLVDTTGAAARLYQLRALPTTFFIDADGVIRKVVIGGPISETTIRTAVAELLDERR